MPNYLISRLNLTCPRNRITLLHMLGLPNDCLKITSDSYFGNCALRFDISCIRRLGCANYYSMKCNYNVSLLYCTINLVILFTLNVNPTFYLFNEMKANMMLYITIFLQVLSLKVGMHHTYWLTRQVI